MAKREQTALIAHCNTGDFWPRTRYRATMYALPTVPIHHASAHG